VLLLICADCTPAPGRTLLKNICRVKGQEENVLSGLGLVVGLKGTGDAGDYLPTMRALARSMELMGSPVGQATRSAGISGELAELKNTKNVALVGVQATVPPTGARRGDKIDCQLSAYSAKSLAGGRLMFAALQGPAVGDPQIYALASGQVHLDDPDVPTVGRIHQGCRLEADFFHRFQKQGAITLVLNKDHADFEVAAGVADMINERFRGHETASFPQDELARAIDPVSIEVTIPSAYQGDPVTFVAEVLSLDIYQPSTEARVVINDRAGSIVIGGDVEIGPVVVTHKNVVVETGTTLPAERFVPIDSQTADSPKLKSLVQVLDALHVPTKDVIEIIKGIERNGKLHGRLIIE
jgi:flagellar P-ring protein precursor FlgI